MASKAARKAIYLQKLRNHLKDNNKHLVIVSADNLCVNQIQAIRQGLRPHSSVVMGKNSFMRRSLEIHAPSAGKPAFVGAVPHINGKVGLILTDCDPEEVSESVAGYKLQPLVCSSMDIGMCSLWQWLLGFHMSLLNTYHISLMEHKRRHGPKGLNGSSQHYTGV
ncbi:60S acidic ribosomal protein P0-1 [Helianthus annuus]|uniref:60S acidic ribosomal protein P0-1 n=1 Tax=Helianthus annuus TaxID=4232 RepID=UPI000B8F73C5|nr:60S acidic ribosomal protein P0-1 [Helianthus annuus]